MRTKRVHVYKCVLNSFSGQLDLKCTLHIQYTCTCVVFLFSNYIFNAGMKQEGIYRLSPSLGDINKLKAALNTGELQCICDITSAYIYIYVYM